MNTGDRVTGTDTALAGKAIRLYEVAKDLGMQNKDLVAKVRALGIEVKNHMSNLEPDDIQRVKRALDKERQATLIETRLSSTVIRRRSREGQGAPAPASRPVAQTSAPAATRAPAPVAQRDSQREDEAAEEVETVVAKPVQRRVVVEAPTARPEPTPAPRSVETAVETKPAQAPAPDQEAPRAQESVAASATADAASQPKKDEPVKYGPTGRMIELPPPRIQITERDPRFVQRDMRGAPTGQRPPGQWDRPGGGGNRFGTPKKKTIQMGKKGKSTQITTPAAHKRVIKMEESVTVGELAKLMSIKATDVLKKLWSMGMTGITLNNSIDHDTAVLLATDFGFEVENVSFQEAAVFNETTDAPEDLVTRAPVVTIMGHVDHGKTSLLDAIRDANVAAGESGGITQHIGAYKVKTPEGLEIVFLDTPGHEAFTAMRARGANATDIVVLVVAADDGVMPTTIEALNHAKQAQAPIIVAVNKIDKQNAQPERVKQQLADHGLLPESWGGETIYAEVSARNKTGIDTLLQMIGLQAEVLELKANPNKPAKGTVIEAKLDRNRGPMATVLVQDGTLRVGDTVVAGEYTGKVRAMIDDKGRTLTEVGPSTPVEVLGIGGVPDAGEALNSAADEKQAKELVEHRRDLRRKKELGTQGRVSLENILDRIKEGAVKELKIVLKADVQGSSEALKQSLMNLGTEQVKVDVISVGVGGITESDVNLAKAGNAIIVGFHVRPAGKAGSLAEQEGVDIKLYDIIYEALDDVKKAMAGLLAPVKREKPLGKAEVRETFSIPKIGMIAGSFVTEGVIRRNALVRLVRDAVQVYQGKLISLRRFKDDAREVVQGYECGVGLEGFNDIKVGDVVEAYEIEEIAATLQ